MRVLQINSVCGIGSTGRIATDIHKILIKQGHESYIAYGRDLPKNCDNVIKIGSKIDNYTHVAKTRILDKHGFGSKRATIEFINKVKEINPDIIHLHNIHGYYINIEILFNYLKEANKPVIWTLHDCWSFTGHCTYFDYVNCEKWKMGCNNCPEKNAYPSSLFLDNSRNNYERKKDIFTGVKDLTIVTPSKWLAKLVSESFLSDYSVSVINNGIDLDIFKPTSKYFRKRLNLNNKFIILGVASTWNRRKGLNYFIEMSNILNDDEIIVLVGLSDKQMMSIPENIIGISRTNNAEELADIYSSANVFVNPTLEDNFPTTNLEALACGIPIVTFDTGGSPESITRLSGIVTINKDAGSIRIAIDNLRKRQVDKNMEDFRKIAIKQYSKESNFEEYVSQYKKRVII